MSGEEDAVEALRAILTTEGAFDAHGWRCAHPDLYGPCNCEAEVAAEVLTRLADALHRDGPDADAIRARLGLHWVTSEPIGGPVDQRRVVGKWVQP